MTEPTGLWEWLILNVFGFIGNYGWRIVVLVIFLKLILSPLDFYQRYKMRKNQRITEALKPQLEKLEKQYGEDKQTLQQKQMELNRKAGFSYMSACIPLIITLVLFITFFTALRSVSTYMEFKQYVEMYDAYVTSYEESGFNYDLRTDGIEYALVFDENEEYKRSDEWLKEVFADENTLNGYIGEEIKNEFSHAHIDNYIDELMKYKVEYIDQNKSYKDFVRDFNGRGGTGDPKEENFPFAMSILMQAKAQEETVSAFENSRTKFLWIKSLWVADVPWSKSLPEWNTFQTAMNNFGYLSEDINNNPSHVYNSEGEENEIRYNSLIKQETYQLVTAKVRDRSDLYDTNGYLIMVVLVVGLSLVSQFISNAQQKKSGQTMQGSGSGMMKVMLWIMPIMLGIFALTSSSAFTLYMVVNSIMTLIINFIMSVIVNLIFGRKREETVIKYGRADPNERNNKK